MTLGAHFVTGDDTSEELQLSIHMLHYILDVRKGYELKEDFSIYFEIENIDKVQKFEE